MIETTRHSHFKRIGERLCLDYANTVGEHASVDYAEYLDDYADVVLWSEDANVITPAEADRLRRDAERHPKQATAIYARAIALREAIFHIFSAVAAGEIPAAHDLDVLNAELDAAPVHLHVQPNEDAFRCDWLADTTALDGMLAPVAWSAATLLASDEVNWVKQCADDTCGWLFLDTTKNHSRRWCDMADCGSRAKAKRYYRRQRSG